MTTNNTTTATTPNAPRSFDVDRKHGVGQFLRAHPEAARVMARMRSDSKSFFSIAARFHA
jgi:anti-sigma factor RsiW